MKKLKKLFAALLATVMLLSLTLPALASPVPLVDPDLCQFCGIGTYTTGTQRFHRMNIADKVPCEHGWPGEYDGMLQAIYYYEGSCTYEGCDWHPYKLGTFAIDQYEVCTHEYTGMSLGGELS